MSMVIHTAFAPEQNAQLVAATDKARRQKLSLLEVLQLAEQWGLAGQAALAAELYKTWTAFNDQSPLLHLAFFNYSVLLKQLGDTAGAINALKAALKAQPMMGQAHINLGRTYEDCGLGAQAIQQWRSYVEATSEITPDKATHRLMALQHIGRVMEGASLLEDAETALWQAIELRPDKPEAGQHWISVRQHQCKWPVVQGSEFVTKRQMLDSISPLPLACYADDPIFQMAKAYRYFKMLAGAPNLRISTSPSRARRSARVSVCASATSRPTFATTPSALLSAKCLNCTTSPRSRSMPTTSVKVATTTPHRTA